MYIFRNPLYLVSALLVCVVAWASVLTTDELRLRSSTAGEYSGFKANSSVTDSGLYVLPAADGTANQVLETDGSKNLSWATISAPNGVPVGTIILSGASSTPSGYLPCDGDEVSRTTYSDLFSSIGSSFGDGDGSTTFNVPDMRWTYPRGYGANISVTGSGTASSNNATFTSHGFNRSGVKVRMTSGTLSGLSTGTDYWTIYVDDNTLAFGSTRANAIAGTKIAISGSNSAVIGQYESPDLGSRVALADGANTGANEGTYEEYTVESHTHPPINNNFWERDTGSPNYDMGLSNVNAETANATGAYGGNETRPMSVMVRYYIKY